MKAKGKKRRTRRRRIFNAAQRRELRVCVPWGRALRVLECTHEEIQPLIDANVLLSRVSHRTTTWSLRLTPGVTVSHAKRVIAALRLATPPACELPTIRQSHWNNAHGTPVPVGSTVQLTTANGHTYTYCVV